MSFTAKILARAPTERARRARAPARRPSRRRSSTEARRASHPRRSARRCRSPNDATTRSGVEAGGSPERLALVDVIAWPARCGERARHGICGHAHGHLPRREMHVVAQTRRRRNDQRERAGPSARRETRGERRHRARRDRRSDRRRSQSAAAADPARRRLSAKIFAYRRAERGSTASP